MTLLRKPAVVILIGAVAVAALAGLAALLNAERMAADLEVKAAAAIAAAGGKPVRADFSPSFAWGTRHPVLAGGETLDEGTRARVAEAVAAIPGVGGVRWADGRALSETASLATEPLDCQKDVESLLRARTIRFEEGSARIDVASETLISEVASALRPCLGSIIAITGHTDASGPEPGNLELSRERADAVLLALVAQGIPADGLRASGVGSRAPVAGLEPTDPANRRIEFSVVATKPVKPTPVDTPGPR